MAQLKKLMDGRLINILYRGRKMQDDNATTTVKANCITQIDYYV